MQFNEIRQKYPEYSDMSDEDFANKFHKKFYSDMDFSSFASKVGYTKEQPEQSGYANFVNSLPRPVQGAIGGFEALGSMALSTPSIIEGFGRKVYSHLTSDGTEEEKRQKALEAASNTFIPSVHAKSEMGKVGEELLGLIPQKVIESAGNLGAEFVRGQTFLNDPTLKNTGQVEQKHGKEGIEAGRTFGELLAEGAMLEPIVSGGVKAVKNFNKPKELSPELKAVQEEMRKQAEEQVKQTRPKELPYFPENKEPILVDSAGEAVPMSQAHSLELFKRAAEEQQRKASLEQPLEFEQVKQPYEPTLIEGQASRVEEGIPYKQEVGFDSINNRIENIKQDEINSTWEQYKQQQLAEQAQAKETAWQRAEAAKEPLTLEPSQGSSLLEKFSNDRTTNRPSPNAGKFGQRGAINPEVFAEGFRKIKDVVKKGLEGVRLEAHNKNGVFYVTAKDWAGKDVAEVQFLKHGDNIESGFTIVDKKQYQGKGLPEEMYKFASELGNDIRASDHQTPSGNFMWDRFIENKLAEKTPTGQRMIAKGQRGSIGFFGKESYEKFAERVRKEIPEAPESAIKAVWEKQQKQQQISVTGTSPDKQQALNKLPWYKKMNEAFLPVENVSKAIEELSGYKNDISYSPAVDKLTSGGVVQAALKNNRVVTVGVDLVNGLKKNAEIKTNEALLGRDGILTQRQHIEKTVGPKQFQSDFLEYVKSSLDPEYKPTYSQAGRSWVENLQKKQSEILSRWNDVRQQLGLKPVKELDNYFSLMREGPFGFTLKAPTGRVINGVAETELVSFVRERTKGSAQRAYEYYKNNLPEGWELSNVEYHTAYERAPFNKKARGEQLAMQDLAAILGDDNVHVQKATDMYNKYLQQEAKNTAGASAREKYRAGIEGAKGTKEWMTPAENVKEGMESIETYFRQINDQIASLEAANQLQKIINDKSIEAPNAKALIQDYYDHAFNRVDRITDSMKGLTKWYEQTTGTDIGLTINGIRMTKNALMKMTLGFGNVGFLATSLIQPFQAMPPMFGYLKDIGAKGNASIAMVQGLGDAMSFFGEQYAGKQKVKFKDKLTASIWDYASKNHITAAHLLEKPTEYTNPTMSNLAKVAEKLSSREMTVFEGATRMMAFSGFTRFLVDSGMPLDMALKSAEKVVEFVMVSYELHNKPRMYSHMGVLGELSSSLRTYQHNNLGQQAFYLKEAMKGNARWAIVQQLVNIAIFGGLLGLPFMADFDGIVDGYNKISGSKITTPTEFIITRFPQAISVGGLSALTGKDFHSRLGMPNVVPDSAVEGLFPLASKPVNMITTGAEFVSNPTVENFGQFAKQPISSLQGTMEHFLLSDKTEDGKMLLRNKKTHTEAIRTPTESTIRVATGFKPLRETLESKENYLAKKDDQYRSKKLESISEDIKHNIAEIISAKQRGHEFRVNAAKQRNQKLAQRYMQLGGTEEGLDKLVDDFAIGRSATTPLQHREAHAAQQDSLMNIFKLNKLKELQQQND